jgi:adenine-specific DNA methylase
MHFIAYMRACQRCFKLGHCQVALPLGAINKASAREKSIRHGHPSTLHLWWARRPLVAARAVIFAQMVDDPSAHSHIFPTEKAQEKERQRLFRIIKPDDFIVAIVEFAVDDSHQVHLCSQAFQARARFRRRERELRFQRAIGPR